VGGYYIGGGWGVGRGVLYRNRRGYYMGVGGCVLYRDRMVCIIYSGSARIFFRGRSPPFKIKIRGDFQKMRGSL